MAGYMDIVAMLTCGAEVEQAPLAPEAKPVVGDEDIIRYGHYCHAHAWGKTKQVGRVIHAGPFGL